MKLCPKCGIEKPATSEYFFRDKSRIDGLYGHCKICKNVSQNRYLSNPEVKQRVTKNIREWQKGVGKEKTAKTRKAYDTSEKRVAWRNKRFFSIDDEQNYTLEQAYNRLLELKKGRGLPV